MRLLLLLFLAIAPSIVLVCYFYQQDKKKPEPKRMVLKIFAFGFVVTLPAIVFEMLSDRLFGMVLYGTLAYDFLKAFIVAALVEEVLKLLVVLRFAYHHVDFDEVMDGIVYTVVASLGFACLENLIYAAECGLGIILVRGITAVPMHAVASGMMGYYIGKAKFSSSEHQARRLIIKGLCYAILFHGVYDFFIFASPRIGEALALAVFPWIFIVFMKLKQKIKFAISEDFHAGRHSPSPVISQDS